MTAPSGAGSMNGMNGAADMAVPDYAEDADELFIGPDIAEFFNEEEQYEDFDPLEVLAPQSGPHELTREGPQAGVESDYTQRSWIRDSDCL